MASNQTANFGLNQWEASDSVLRADFNADNAKLDAALAGLLPSGCVLLWSGGADAIPAGWALCDGSNGTPDLRGRFVVGAGGGYAAGDTGGAASASLTGYRETSGSIFGTLYAFSSAAMDNRPPYYALCYIMRL